MGRKNAEPDVADSSTALDRYQEELLFTFLTPREHLTFHATARLQHCTTKQRYEKGGRARRHDIGEYVSVSAH